MRYVKGAWVTRDTVRADILLNLTLRNIPDLTKEIDLDLASTTPFATGGSADIFRGHYNGELIAIKVPRLDQKHPEDDGRKIAARGVYNWSKCRHPNIHQLLGFTIFHSRVGMVSPYEKNGNVRHYLATNTTSIQERLDLKFVSSHEWLSTLRSQVHGDIKGNNVLISGDGIAMLTDFDNAELEEQSLIFTRTGRLVLSPRWTAPEVILGLTGKTLEADVYSLAMEMMTCKAPWANIPTDIGVVPAVLLQKKVPPRPTSIVRGDLWAILVDCWKHEQNARPGPADILKMNTISSPIPEREPIAIAYPRPFLLPVPPGLSLVGNGGEIPGSSRSKGFIRPSLAGHHPQPRSRFRFHFHFRFHFRFRFRFRFPGPCAAPDVNSPGEPLEFSEVDFLSQENPEPDIPSQVDTIALSRCMPVHDMLSHLNSHGCRKFSQSLDSNTFSVLPSCYGGSGDIYYGKLLDSTTICVKVPRIVEDASQMEMKDLYASREIHTWSKCNHPNILPLLGLAIFRNRLAIVSPWMQNGTLPDFLKKNPNADRFQLVGNTIVSLCSIINTPMHLPPVYTNLRWSCILTQYKYRKLNLPETRSSIRLTHKSCERFMVI
ncbi:protein tyrosine kinase domain-containing protein [Rhizoctonia solani AG-1 IA]|uniref:Protein tyrosine kinase domain-containing protein n=1 Tax=Thanatephorus cucumeris (strain AG1-IA) TaxID=983506 RepID=L8WL63_THACA|nr:protein tyrosine kinase domain-containing protein [Rhizoctonia solani AG-1 IA]